MTPPLPRLASSRVVLRPLQESDLDGLADIVSAEGVREWWGALPSREQLR